MKLRRIEIQRLPGIDEPFALPAREGGEGADGPLDAGVHVILGPNAIGKSSLFRAVAALLWREPEMPGEAPGPPHYATSVHASALFEIEGVRWRAVRDGPHLRWQREGVDASPPPLPPDRHASCFFLGLRDLLALTPAAGRDVAAEIRRQLAGGFDLGGVEKALFGEVRQRFGHHERRQVDERRRKVRSAERRHRELGSREAGIEELEARLGEAEAARVRAEHVATARELGRLRDELARVEGELRALPAALEDLTGREEEELAGREGELEDRLRQRTEAARQKEVSAREAAEAGLAAPLPASGLQELDARVQALQRVEGDLEAARRERAERDGALARARRDLGDRAEPEAELDPAAAAALLALLRRAEHCAAQRQGVAEQLHVLEAVPAPGPDEARALDRLRRGVERLRAWLRAPEPGLLAAAVGGRGGMLAAVLLVAAGALLLVAGAPVLGPLGGLLVGLGVGLGTAGALLRRWSRAGAAAREAARLEYPAELDPPAGWRTAEVVRRLDELEGEVARLQARAERAERREAERTRLEVRRRELDEERRDLDAQRAELARGLGLEELPDAELADVVERLARLREARRAAESARARAEELERHRDALLEDLAGALRPHDVSAPRDAAVAQAAVSELRSRSEALARAREREAAAAERLRRLDAEIARLRGDVTGIYRRAGLEPDDRAGLGRHLGDLARHRELRDRRRELRVLVDHQQRSLEDAGAADLVERSEAELEAEATRLDAQAQEAERLRRQIHDIQADVRQAREGHELEEALARHDEALARLRDKRDARLRAEAGRFLLGAIEREHEASQRPRVLERARRLFATFTHHRYELQVVPEDQHSFVALETSTGAGLRPDQLSDGTRAQLVLAARLAFAEEAETEAGGRLHLPIFLDEALDHSDPERFEAIARSLGRMAAGDDLDPGEPGGLGDPGGKARAGGRQLFYLTTEPADAARLERALVAEGCPPPRLIDLAAARRRAASVPGPEALHVEALPAPPRPEGHDAASYGAALGVPGLRPARGPGAQHLLHLLWDDLPLLHRLLAHRIERVGAWTHLSREDAPLARELRKAGRAGSELDDRAELLAAFCEAWQVGRGRPVDREVLERSGAVSDRFMEDVVAVARDLGGDPRRLIEALRERSDERLKGFQSQKTEQLQEFLVAGGYLDLRDPSPPEEILQHVLARPAAARLPEGRAAACCHRWTRLAGYPLPEASRAGEPSGGDSMAGEAEEAGEAG